ncbi:MAG: hypothetical protein IJB27_01160 [Clostridia bacterium]|nr:hypothetical protein [Clostridia bacterium]
MDLTEKIAYLKGMLEGMEIDKDSKEGKIYTAIMDVLTDMALTIEDMVDYVDELSEQVDEIDEDLANVEEFLEEEFDDDCDCDCDCDCCDDEDEWDDEFYEITCPACSATFEVDEETLLDGGIACPECDEPLEFDIECEDDCDCGCCGEDEE